MRSIKSLPLIIIAGPTASGKTALAIELAKMYNGEIICADSRSIYKGLDIGTAKPTVEEQQIVPHWGLDLVEPGEYFSAADFKKYAEQKISEIRARGHVPFLVGGTGLYIDAVMFDYQFGEKANKKLRQKLQQMTIEQLHVYCSEHKIQLPENSKNKRYVIRAIETRGDQKSRRSDPVSNTVIVGIATDREVLRDRIRKRADHFFSSGVVEEAKRMGDIYGWESEAMKSNIYPLLRQYNEGEMTLAEVKQRFGTLDWRLAKRQITWLKRNKYVRWLDLNDAYDYLCKQLAMIK